MDKASRTRAASSKNHGARLDLYVIALGSNRPLSGALPPRAILCAALAALKQAAIKVEAVAPILSSRPIGPSLRNYANSAAIISTRLSPLELLDALQRVEARFGRRRHRRWGARTLDLDILLWGGGIWHSRRLTIPHVAMAERDFVLRPLRAIAPCWRIPGYALTARHLSVRLARPKPVDPTPSPR